MVENSKIGRIIFLGFGAAQDINIRKSRQNICSQEAVRRFCTVRYLDGCIGVYGLPDWDVELYFS